MNTKIIYDIKGKSKPSYNPSVFREIRKLGSRGCLRVSLDTLSVTEINCASPAPGWPYGSCRQPQNSPFPETTHAAAGSLVKTWTIPETGAFIPRRPQPFASMVFIAAGAVRVARDGMDLGELYTPAAVEITAFARHLFVTIEPDTTLLEIHNIMSGETRLLEEG